MNDIPCKCRHSEELHKRTLGTNSNSHCWLFECDCKEYVPDNLKYLEELYDNKK